MNESIELSNKVWQECIAPKLEDKYIKNKAAAMELPTQLKLEDAANLYNKIFSEAIDEIAHFLKRPDAKQICRSVDLYSPRAFAKDISSPLENKIYEIYKIDLSCNFSQPTENKSILSWLWTVLGVS